MKKVPSIFWMNDAESMSTHLANHLNYQMNSHPLQSMKEPIRSTIGNLMNAMMCTRSNIAHATGVDNIY